MTRIFVFPGQGAQSKGMGAGLFDRFPALERAADQILGYSIRRLCLEDPSGDLGRTQFTQPALYAVEALGYLARVDDLGSEPDFVAGHSLGEYSALFAAGAFSFEDGLRLVQRRGALMGAIEGGGMMAVAGVADSRLAELLRSHGFTGIDLANYNSPTQTVLAGPVADLDRFATILDGERGARFVKLNVRTAFHSRYMQPVKEAFGAFIADFRFRPLLIPTMANCTAKPYRDHEIAHNLVQQIDHSVRWTECVRYMAREPEAEFEEIGPGKVLTRLIAEINKKENA
jgi:malonyl CoA-acyl carrier protein transacylase